MKNVVNDPKYKDTIAKMIDTIIDGFDVEGFVEDQVHLQKTRMFIQRARNKSDSDKLAWDYQPKRDPSEQYVRAAVNVTPAR